MQRVKVILEETGLKYKQNASIEVLGQMKALIFKQKQPKSAYFAEPDHQFSQSIFIQKQVVSPSHFQLCIILFSALRSSIFK